MAVPSSSLCSSALQVELWNGSKIVWPDRVAIVGYGVKGVGKGGKARWTCLTFDLSVLASGTRSAFDLKLTFDIHHFLSHCQVNIGTKILEESKLKSAWEHRLNHMMKNKCPGSK